MGFFELLVIAVVGLLVFGPERLPEVVRSTGLWVGRLKRSLRETRTEVERQLGMDDIRRQLHNEDIMRSLEATRRDIEQSIDPARANRMHSNQYDNHQELPDHAHGEAAATSEAAATAPRKDDNPP